MGDLGCRNTAELRQRARLLQLLELLAVLTLLDLVVTKQYVLAVHCWLHEHPLVLAGMAPAVPIPLPVSAVLCPEAAEL